MRPTVAQSVGVDISKDAMRKLLILASALIRDQSPLTLDQHGHYRGRTGVRATAFIPFASTHRDLRAPNSTDSTLPPPLARLSPAP